MLVVWLIVWLLVGVFDTFPTVDFSQPSPWAIALVVCGCVDLFGSIRRR